MAPLAELDASILNVTAPKSMALCMLTFEPAAPESEVYIETTTFVEESPNFEVTLLLKETNPVEFFNGE